VEIEFLIGAIAFVSSNLQWQSTDKLTVHTVNVNSLPRRIPPRASDMFARNGRKHIHSDRLIQVSQEASATYSWYALAGEAPRSALNASLRQTTSLQRPASMTRNWHSSLCRTHRDSKVTVYLYSASLHHARHQRTLWDHEYGLVYHTVCPVYSPSFHQVLILAYHRVQAQTE